MAAPSGCVQQGGAEVGGARADSHLAEPAQRAEGGVQGQGEGAHPRLSTQNRNSCQLLQWGFNVRALVLAIILKSLAEYIARVLLGKTVSHHLSSILDR